MRETIRWQLLNRDVAEELHRKKVLAIRGDAKMYAGTLVEFTTSYAVLASGNHRQHLVFVNHRYMVAEFEGPPPWTPRLADPRFNFND